jgi:hypothetical protein
MFSFPKYSICGAAVHKEYFFFHWIDLHYLYKTRIIFVKVVYDTSPGTTTRAVHGGSLLEGLRL